MNTYLYLTLPPGGCAHYPHFPNTRALSSWGGVAGQQHGRGERYCRLGVLGHGLSQGNEGPQVRRGEGLLRREWWDGDARWEGWRGKSGGSPTDRLWGGILQFGYSVHYLFPKNPTSKHHESLLSLAIGFMLEETATTGCRLSENSKMRSKRLKNEVVRCNLMLRDYLTNGSCPDQLAIRIAQMK